MGEKKAQEITTEVMGVGTRMHKYPEDYVETGEWSHPGSNPMPQAHMMATLLEIMHLMLMRYGALAIHTCPRCMQAQLIW